jgi:hypothetical protein
MTLSLNCYLLGDDPNRMFTVKVPETDNVSILKKLIKEEKAPHLNHVAASDLDIWKVDLPISNFQKNLGKINLVDNNSLSPLDELSQVFLAPLSRHVHVVIKRPSVGDPGEFPFDGTYCGKTLELTVT